MSAINNINQQILQVSEFIDDYSIKVKENPSDLSFKIMIQSLENQLKELQIQLKKENINRFKEILEVRLIGDKANFGTLPLKAVGELTNPFALAIFNASKHIQYGNRNGKIIDNLVNKTIDLRLEDIGVGSTILYVSGKTSPDLFGNSLIQSSIQQAYSFFESSNSEELFENIPKIGIRSVKNFANFFKVLSNEDLELDLGWDSPFERRYEWKGDHDKIISLYSALNQIIVSSPEQISFRGEIISMSLRGKLELFSFESERIICRFPLELSEKIRLFHLGDICKGVLLKSTYINQTTGAEKYEYLLQTIEPENF